jgi:hypothetical protein
MKSLIQHLEWDNIAELGECIAEGFCSTTVVGYDCAKIGRSELIPSFETQLPARTGCWWLGTTPSFIKNAEQLPYNRYDAHDHGMLSRAEGADVPQNRRTATSSPTLAASPLDKVMWNCTKNWIQACGFRQDSVRRCNIQYLGATATSTEHQIVFSLRFQNGIAVYITDTPNYKWMQNVFEKNGGET